MAAKRGSTSTVILRSGRCCLSRESAGVVSTQSPSERRRITTIREPDGSRSSRFSTYSSMRASSTSITGMSARIGYTRLHSTHFRPFSSFFSTTGALHSGQTRISSRSLLMAISKEQCNKEEPGARSQEPEWPRILFRQRLSSRFGRPGENGQSDEKHQAHGDSGVAHRFFCSSIDAAGEEAQGQRPDGGYQSADVVAERRPGAAQARGEELRKVNCVTAEQRDLEEAHRRDHPEHVAELLQLPEGE